MKTVHFISRISNGFIFILRSVDLLLAPNSFIELLVNVIENWKFCHHKVKASHIEINECLTV
jgi:hypothetical protein